MVAPSCTKCGGTRWVRYFSETTEGDFEEPLRTCPCNYEPQTCGERSGEELERVEIAEGELANSSGRDTQTPA